MERRNFFKLAGVSAATLTMSGLLAGCSASSPSSLFGKGQTNSAEFSLGSPISFSNETDVLIIGSGIAGLSAAIDPSEAGLSVLIADKMDLIGGESYGAVGLIPAAGTKIQKDAGISTSIDDAWKAYSSQLKAEGITADLDFGKLLYAAQTTWIDRIVTTYGAQFANPKDYLDKGSPDTFLIPKNGLNNMESIMLPLKNILTSQGVTFTLGIRAHDFILDANSQVAGVRFFNQKVGTFTDIAAKRIIVATGGFSCNQEMIQAYLPQQASLACYSTYTAGDGHYLCLSIQGKLSNMEQIPPLTSDIPQVTSWGYFAPILALAPSGKRIAAEDNPGTSASACVNQELGFWWTVFDKQLSDNGQSKSISYVNGKNPKRVVGPCDTLDDLANELHTSADTLKETFASYHTLVEKNDDTDFGKTTFLKALNPPYYAVKQFPRRFQTFGGATTDNNARLLDSAGNPIERVYCCGSCAAGSFGGLGIQGAYGMIAGKTACDDLNAENH